MAVRPMFDGMTVEQELVLRRLCDAYRVTFDDGDYLRNLFDLPSGYVAGWIGGHLGNPGRTIYVGVSPEGDASS